jgi:transcriptional regulator with XRE-family HTH domain
MKNPITELRQRVQKSSQLEVAQSLGISPQYLCDVLKGRAAPGKKILAALGMKRRIIHDRIAS